jgi:excinuclease UvrABC ATPase subunit
MMAQCLARTILEEVRSFLLKKKIIRRISQEREATKFSLGRGHRRTAEDLCKVCSGAGVLGSPPLATSVIDKTCRVCKGKRYQPRDKSLVEKLNKIWHGKTDRS